jgi:hypothetical protein
VESGVEIPVEQRGGGAEIFELVLLSEKSMAARTGMSVDIWEVEVDEEGAKCSLKM